MDFSEAEGLIHGDHSAFGPRPLDKTVPWAVYVETTGVRCSRRPHKSDRWRGSGGIVGSVQWPQHGKPRLRRKYGTVTTYGCEGKPEDTLNFIEYSRIQWEDTNNRGVTVYQTFPRSAPHRKVPRCGGSTPVSFEEAERLLLVDDKEVAHLQDRPVQMGNGPVHHQVYFEKKKSRRRSSNSSSPADRWNTSGGLKGSTVWPSTGQPRVRRRYGRVTTRQTVLGSPGLRFVMYSLLRKEEDDICMEPGEEDRRSFRCQTTSRGCIRL